MKLLLCTALLILSPICLGEMGISIVTDECGRTYEEYINDTSVSCFSIVGDVVMRSGFTGSIPDVWAEMTIEELEQEWEIVE
jgi:hypothetical protein